MTTKSETTDGDVPDPIGFRQVNANTPRDEWLLVRWRNTTTGQWMFPVVARGGGPGWWDGKRDWWPESAEVQWCRVPGEASDATPPPLSPADLNLIRQWYTNLAKVAPRYLGRPDVELAARIGRALAERDGAPNPNENPARSL